jgi:hypothetical protein
MILRGLPTFRFIGSYSFDSWQEVEEETFLEASSYECGGLITEWGSLSSILALLFKLFSVLRMFCFLNLSRATLGGLPLGLFWLELLVYRRLFLRVSRDLLIRLIEGFRL